MAATATTQAPDRTVRIGVFAPYPVQLLDAACVDVFGSMSKQYLSELGDAVPAAIRDQAPSVEIRYIGNRDSAAADEDPAGVHKLQPLQTADGVAAPTIRMTTGQRVVATHDYRDPAVAPGTLDILIVPGPNPFEKFAPEVLECLAAHFASTSGSGTDVLSVCTGIFLCGAAGLLRGRRAAGPRGFQHLFSGAGFGEKELVGHKLRWVKDGNLWSAGGVTNGNDLVAAYCRDPEAGGRFFTPMIAEMGIGVTEVGDRLQEYPAEHAWSKELQETVALVTASMGPIGG